MTTLPTSSRDLTRPHDLCFPTSCLPMAMEKIKNIHKLQELITCPLEELHYSEVFCTCSHYSQQLQSLISQLWLKLLLLLLKTMYFMNTKCISWSYLMSPINHGETL